jgi:hypothetical protein
VTRFDKRLWYKKRFRPQRFERFVRLEQVKGLKPREKFMASKESDSIYNRIRQILESARTNAARSVNTTQVVACWLIGREIVEEQQRGQKRAA